MFRVLRRMLTPESLFAVLASLLCTASLSVLASSGYWSNPTVVAPAVMVDLALGFPVLGYLLLVRTRRADPLALLPMFFVGVLLARWWIPEPHRLASEPIKIAAVVGESAVLLLLAVRIRKIQRTFAKRKACHPYPSEAMEVALEEVLGRRLGAIVFSEGAALWFGLAGWRRPRNRNSSGPVFPDLKRSGYPAILSAVILLILIETVAGHLLVGLWNERVAWALSGLGAYSVVWLLGDFNAARHQPTVVSGVGLHLRSGLRWRLDVPWSAVRGLRLDPPEEKVLRLTRLGSPCLWIEFEAPQNARGLLGVKRQARVVGLGLDDPAEFHRLIEDRLSTQLSEE